MAAKPNRKLVAVFPSARERKRVNEVLDDVKEAEFDEVVILGIRNGKTSLHHSCVDSSIKIVGALELIKHRLFEN